MLTSTMITQDSDGFNVRDRITTDRVRGPYATESDAIREAQYEESCRAFVRASNWESRHYDLSGLD